MNKKEVFDWLWNNKPFWERNSDDEVRFQKELIVIEEYIISGINR